jgi:protein-ribulosamine 3-kinase
MLHTNIDWQSIAQHIAQTIEQDFQVHAHYPISGGCINQAFRIEGLGQHYFVKLNQPTELTMFESEAAGLAELAQPAVIKVPVPICWGRTSQHAYLVTEYITMPGNARSAGVQLGHQLAVLHQVMHAPYGWYRDNYIGSSIQINQFENDWVSFWQKNRLAYQLELAAHRGYGGNLQRQGEKLLHELPAFFRTYTPSPSLLHGDLWSGNYAIDGDGQPVIFDPAIYYGDRETDIAMTELFGGFPSDFYSAYQEKWPLDSGYNTRKVLYNLYHILNHLNLFGGSYLSQAESMIGQLLSELS